MWPPHFEEDEPQSEDERENDLRISQARPDRDALRAGTSRSGLGLRSVKKESRKLGHALARDSNIPRAGPGAVGPAWPGRAPLAKVGSTRKHRWVGYIIIFCSLKISRKVTFFGLFRSN